MINNPFLLKRGTIHSKINNNNQVMETNGRGTSQFNVDGYKIHGPPIQRYITITPLYSVF